MPRIRRVMDRTCIVCGYNLGPYGRICDKCGSIQRPAAGSGAMLPPDRFRPCERCGEPIPEESQETLCDGCIEKDKPRPIIVFDDTDKIQKTKRAAIAGSAVSLAVLVGCGVTLSFVSSVWLIVVVALSGVALGVSGAIVMIVSRRLPGKIEYYAPIKPQPPK
jgi:hypothetical protein